MCLYFSMGYKSKTQLANVAFFPLYFHPWLRICLSDVVSEINFWLSSDLKYIFSSLVFENAHFCSQKDAIIIWTVFLFCIPIVLLSRNRGANGTIPAHFGFCNLLFIKIWASGDFTNYINHLTPLDCSPSNSQEVLELLTTVVLQKHSWALQHPFDAHSQAGWW